MRFPIIAVFAVAVSLAASPGFAAALPDAAVDEPRAAITGSRSIVLAGGCFWGVEGVFDHTKGVGKAVSGYAGGKADTATYDQVSTGTTGHAESVEITYDPSVITLGQILKIYFSVVQDPTELNYQGPDHGTQYRSAIFVSTPEQQRIAAAYIAQLDAVKAFHAPIVTQVNQLDKFYPAETYHQNYLNDHPYQPYIMINDAPKVAALRTQFPDFYKK